MSGMKVCNACGIEKPLDAFNKNKRRKDGLSGKCRECESAYRRKWYHDNPNKWRIYRARDYAKNGDKRREAHRAYYLAHREEAIEYQRQYREQPGYRKYKHMYDNLRYKAKKVMSA